MMTSYPSKTRSAAVNKGQPGRSKTTEVNKVCTTRASMHGSTHEGKGLTNKKGLPRGR